MSTVLFIQTRWLSCSCDFYAFWWFLVHEILSFVCFAPFDVFFLRFEWEFVYVRSWMAVLVGFTVVLAVIIVKHPRRTNAVLFVLLLFIVIIIAHSNGVRSLVYDARHLQALLSRIPPPCTFFYALFVVVRQYIALLNTICRKCLH